MLIRSETAPRENKDDPPPCSILEMHTHTHTHTQVHPIFVLSIADGMLAVLWVMGGALWLRGGVSQNRVGCFAVSLMTVVSVCVCVGEWVWDGYVCGWVGVGEGVWDGCVWVGEWVWDGCVWVRGVG